jgi:rhamnosyltransferase
MTSIIIRTKNEERWIGHCLSAVFSQNYKDFEVIIVDNESVDGTLKKVGRFPVKIINISNYTHGKALNLGVQNSKGNILIFLSGHCIPVDKNWLSNLLNEFKDNKVAGVYGRQVPMSFSSPQTKRDLLITFGLDKIIQRKDSFFHNANSAIRRSAWNKVKFDDDVTNIEDRVWASHIINLGYHIVYTPDASVYHYHGIHHDNDIERVKGTVNVIENYISNNHGNINISDLSIICIIPIKKSFLNNFKDNSILKNTIEYAQKFDFIDKVIVLTDSNDLSEYVVKLGAEIPLIRDESDSSHLVDLRMVYEKYYREVESIMDIHPDIVVSLEPSYPLRPDNLLDEMLSLLLSKGFDSVIPIIKDYNWTWAENNENYERIDSDLPRNIKKPIIHSLKGLACVTYSEFIRNGKIIGDNVGMIEVDKVVDQFEIKNSQSLHQALDRLSFLKDKI